VGYVFEATIENSYATGKYWVEVAQTLAVFGVTWQHNHECVFDGIAFRRQLCGRPCRYVNDNVT